MRTDVVVIGAGQAGLSAAHGLRRAGLEPGAGFVVLDAEDGPGGAWRHRWPTLRMDRSDDLPGLPFDPVDPTRPACEAVPAYFTDYERRFGLQVVRPVRVSAVRNASPNLLVETDHGSWRTRAVINATGTWTRPFRPIYPGHETFRGPQLHTAQYRGPEAFTNLRVVVVGGGTSAVQLLREIAPVAASTTWVTRRPPAFHEEAGILDRRPMFDHLTREGVVWADGTSEPADAILWATGWRAELAHLSPLGLRGRGGGIVVDGTRVVADPRVHLVGHGPCAGVIGANRAGRAAAYEVAALLLRDPPVSSR